MLNTFTLFFAALAASVAVSAQTSTPTGDWYYQIGYAANLNVGDSVVNISNDGWNGGFFGANPPTAGNLCVNVYTFDPQEEEVSCCSCLVTPNGLVSLSADADLISNTSTPAVPTSIVIKLVSSVPAKDTTGAYTVCNPKSVTATAPTFTGLYDVGNVPVTPPSNYVSSGMLAWGSTMEPNATPGTYNAVTMEFKPANLSMGKGSELAALTAVCNFIQAESTGFGICKSCNIGALSSGKP